MPKAAPSESPSPLSEAIATRADLIRKARRKRAERMVARYLRLTFEMRSAAGRMVVDETRKLGKCRVEIDLEEATRAEVLDAIWTSSIRRAVYATVKAPIVFGSKTNEPIRRVVPARDAVQVIRSKAKRSGPTPLYDVRDWHADVYGQLQALQEDERSALLEVAAIRDELVILVNHLAAARSESGRLKHGGRNARNLRRHADLRVSELRSRETMLSDRRNHLIRGRAYRDGLENLVAGCTRTPEKEAYYFGGD